MSKTMEEDRSQPPTPDGTGLPVNFHLVGPGIYRSSYPQAAHLDRLKPLNFRTVLTLVPETATEEQEAIAAFMLTQKITHLRLPVLPNKDASTAAASTPSSTILHILSYLLDRHNHPVLVHCNKGKHRTGCITACFRKVTGWTDDAAVAEYERYASPKDRPLDKAFIRAFDPQPLKALALENGFVGGAFAQPGTYLGTSRESAYTVTTVESDLSAISMD